MLFTTPTQWIALAVALVAGLPELFGDRVRGVRALLALRPVELRVVDLRVFP